MHAKKHSSNFTNFSKRWLSFKTQFNVEFLLPVTGSRKMLGIIPATIGIATTIFFTSRICWILFGCFHIFFVSFLIIDPQLLLIFSDTVNRTLHNESKYSESFEKEKYIITAKKKWSFPLRISSVNVTFTEEILNRKLHFLCSVWQV